MSQILVIADDPSTLLTTEHILQLVGHSVPSAPSAEPAPSAQPAESVPPALEALRLAETDRPVLIITNLRSSDVASLDVIRAIRQVRSEVLVIVVTPPDGLRDVVEAVQHHTSDVLQEPLGDDQMACAVAHALATADGHVRSADIADSQEYEAHSAARWARCVVRIVSYPKDPRTLAGWSRWMFASEGALRNWCWAAGISPRRSLVFGRLLRAVCRSDGGRYALRNLLDVVDRRTLSNLLTYAGFNDERTFPHDISEFLARQQLVHDPDMICEIKKALVASRVAPATPAAAKVER